MWWTPNSRYRTFEMRTLYDVGFLIDARVSREANLDDTHPTERHVSSRTFGQKRANEEPEKGRATAAAAAAAAPASLAFPTRALQ